MAEPIRVLVVDDQALLRQSLAALIDTAPGMTVAGQAATGREAVELWGRERPDVVLMDVRMPEMDGIEATERICGDAESTTRVLILTTFDLDEYVYAALRAGASGFLLKDSTATQLLSAVQLVAAGEALLAPSVTRRLIGEFARRPARPATGAHPLQVTGREHEVFVLVAHGLSNAEIAERLFLSVGTVKTHVGRLLRKLGVRDRAQLVIAAYESGVVTPRGPGEG